MQKRLPAALIIFLLALITFGAFREALRSDFITAYDDAIYVTKNPYISSGISFESLSWALTSRYAANWHPVTWISHTLDIELFGLNPYGHHLVSLLIHIADTILLFLILLRGTDCIGKSFLVALLFAVHPTRVESVVWVAERKDVLSTLFAFLAVHAYISYLKRKRVWVYILVIILFSFALASKPMVVTLPVILLLMDLWPLNRFRKGLKAGDAVVEKLPLFLLSLLTGIITFIAQESSGALELSGGLSLTDRLSHSFTSYIDYIFLLFWPFRLSPYYPFPEDISVFSGVLSLLLLACVTWTIFNLFSVARYLIVGWLWFIVSLFPVIGFIQAGAQGMADRYTYLPATGLFLAVVFGGEAMLKTRSRLKLFYSTGACVSVALFCVLTSFQVSFWHDSVTLFERAVRVTKRNIHAHHNLGVAYSALGRTDDAISQYKKVLEIRPGDTLANHNLGLAYMKEGQVSKAVFYFREALKTDPGMGMTHFNLALGLIRMKELSPAVEELKRTIELMPDYKYAFFRLGAVEQKMGNFPEARKYFSLAIRIDPDFSEARVNLGNILEDVYNDIEGALSHYRAALRASPESAEAHNSIGILLAGKGRLREAEAHFTTAIGLEPGYEDALRNLARVKEELEKQL